jgi:hypothetical protein
MCELALTNKMHSIPGAFPINWSLFQTKPRLGLPANSTFSSEQISYQQPATSTFLSQQTSTGQTERRKGEGDAAKGCVVKGAVVQQEQRALPSFAFALLLCAFFLRCSSACPSPKKWLLLACLHPGSAATVLQQASGTTAAASASFSCPCAALPPYPYVQLCDGPTDRSVLETAWTRPRSPLLLPNSPCLPALCSVVAVHLQTRCISPARARPFFCCTRFAASIAGGIGCARPRRLVATAGRPAGRPAVQAHRPSDDENPAWPPAR